MKTFVLRYRGADGSMHDIAVLRGAKGEQGIPGEPGQSPALSLNGNPIDGGNIIVTPDGIGAATRDHTHDMLDNIDQDVKSTASPTFNVVTANKVIGAVYQ